MAVPDFAGRTDGKPPHGMWPCFQSFYLFDGNALADRMIVQAAERTLEQSAGVNMNTWFVGYHPIGHYSHIFETPRKDETGQELAGEKTFFMKSRIMAGQADLTNNQLGLEDFKWLSKDEIQHVVPLDYYLSIRNMLSER